MRYLIFLIAILALVSCGSHKNKSNFAKNVVVAHRGAWKAYALPPNSIAALRQAIALKCAGSEFDIWMTADDSLVVTHDDYYNNLLIEGASYSDLAVLKLSNGETLPTLRDYITVGLGKNSLTRLVCEIKPSKTTERGQEVAEKTIRLVNELNSQDITIFISFDYEILKKIEELNPKVQTQYLKADKSPKELKADGIDGADYTYKSFKMHPEWIKSAKENNIILNVWTVNKSKDIDLFLENGFDFITTDEPELLLSKTK